MDLTVEDYAKDKRISRVPYHALTNLEKETYTARAQVLEYLVHQLRQECYLIEVRPDVTRLDGRTRPALCRKTDLLVDNQTTGGRKRSTSLLGRKARSTLKADHVDPSEVTHCLNFLPSEDFSAQMQCTKMDCIVKFGKLLRHPN